MNEQNYVLVSPGAVICPSCSYVMGGLLKDGALWAECANLRCDKNGLKFKIDLQRVEAIPVASEGE